MMAQNITRFTLVMVFLGVILALAIFRPSLLAPFEGLMSSDPMPATRQPEPAQAPGDAEPQAHRGEGDLGPGKRKPHPATWESMLLKWEDELREREANLRNQEQNLTEQQEAVQADLAHLDGELARLQEMETALRAKEASLVEREQKVHRLHRFSVVALIVSSLMGVPAIVFLIVLVRQGPRTPDEVTKQAPQPDEGEQIARYKVVPSQTHGSNGRNKETVKQDLRN